MFSPNRVPTVSKKAVQVQKKFRRDAFIFELGELRRAARSLCQSAGKTRDCSAAHSSECRLGQRRRGKWLWRRFDFESRWEKRDATTAPLIYVRNRNLMDVIHAETHQIFEKSVGGVDRQ
jgi:hypothetical protein